MSFKCLRSLSFAMARWLVSGYSKSRCSCTMASVCNADSLPVCAVADYASIAGQLPGRRSVCLSSMPSEHLPRHTFRFLPSLI